MHAHHAHNSMKLITSNRAKYAELNHMIQAANIELAHPPKPVLEVQSLDLSEVGRHKAETMYALIGGAVVVDDAALLLDAYPDFPGALTKLILQAIGITGIQLLLSGKSHAGTLVCMLSVCESPGIITQFSGILRGSISPSLPIQADLPLNGAFIPEGAVDCLAVLKQREIDFLDHRRHAMQQLVEWIDAREDLANEVK